MTFMHFGLAMGGVAAISIPIIIHLLFHRKRKPIAWGAMRFIIEAYRKQRRRLTLEQLLLLAARCLVIALVALAIGRPLLDRAGAAGSVGAKTLYLLIDNGLASSMRQGDASALDRHKEQAIAILASLGAGDRVGLVSLAAPAQALVAPASADITAIRELIEQLEPTDAATDLAGALEHLHVAMDAEDQAQTGDTIAVILSDFLLGSTDVSKPLQNILRDQPSLTLLASKPIESEPGNVQVLGVEPLRPVVLTGDSDTASSEQVTVRLRRTGSIVATAGVTTVRLTAAGREDRAPSSPVAQQTVRWRPGQSEATTSVALDAGKLGADSLGAAGADLSIIAQIDRDAIEADNVFRKPLDVRHELRVGVIARRRFGAAPAADRLDASNWLALALRPTDSSPIDVVQIEPEAIDAPTLSRWSVALLPRPDLVTEEGWRRLAAFLGRGGMLMVFPPAQATLHLWGDALREQLGLPWRIAREAVEFDEPLALAAEQPRSSMLRLIADELDELVRPIRISRLVPLEETPDTSQPLLTLQDGSPWIVAETPHLTDDADEAARGAERGLVVYMASAPTLSWTDMPAKPLMVPLMQELVRAGVARARGSWTSLAGERAVAPSRTVELRPKGTSQPQSHSIMVGLQGVSAEAIRSAGLFDAIDDRGAARGVVAVNADTAAGRTDVQSPAALQAWLTGAGASSLTWLDASDEKTPLQSLADSDRHSPISLPLLIAALVVGLFETLMARFFSHAFRETTTATGEPA